MAAHTTPLKLLVDWANSQDAWVRLIAGEALTVRKPLGDDQFASVYEAFLCEKELQAGTQPNVPKLAALPGGDEIVEKLELRRLDGVEGVNALATGGIIDFSQKLTVLFGENAAGKSGYVRIIKRIAAVRSQEEVLPNVRPGAPQAESKATITYRVGATDTPYLWTGEAGVSPFTRICVFDTRATRFHLDEDLTYSYTPRDLSLFRIVHTGIEQVRDRLESARKAAQPASNPFTSLFSRGTRIFPKIETLGPYTNVSELEALSKVSPEEFAQLDGLRTSIEALRSGVNKARLETARSDRDLYDAIRISTTEVTSIDFSRYHELVTAVSDARERHLSATEMAFEGSSVPGVLQSEWTSFVQAGEAYIRSQGSAAYPATGEPCVYCRQPLEQAAVSLIQKYRDFTNSQARQQVDAAIAERNQVTGRIRGLDFASLHGQVQRRVGSMDAAAVPPILRDALTFTTQAQGIQTALAAGDALDSDAWISFKSLAQSVTAGAITSHSQATELAGNLAAEATERQRVLQEQESKLADIEARLKLAEQLLQVTSHVDKLKWGAKAIAVIATFQGLLRSLTETSKTASEELVNQDFERLFKEECKALRAPEVKLDFPGREGQAKRRKTLVKDHALSEILSEGEQKAIALADFLAEAGLPTLVAPIVFDDPVNSLDYKRLRYVVDRLFQLSSERQIIVFTHNIWFTAELLSRFEKAPSQDCKYYEISSQDNAVGLIEAVPHGPKWDTPKEIGKKIDERVQSAEKLSGVAREDVVRGAYSQIRGWCETFVEQELLKGVSARYRPHVRMTVLPQIKADRIDAAVKVVLPIFESACRITEAHSQPLETLGIKPTLEDLKKDWAALEAARKAYIET